MSFIKKRNFLNFLISSSILFSSLPGIAMEEEITLDELPSCVLSYTLSFLPDRDLGSIALVSKQFSGILDQDIFWQGRKEGIKTKEDYINFIKKTVLSLKLTENDSIILSPYDVLNIATMSKIIINDGVYLLPNNDNRLYLNNHRVNLVSHLNLHQHIQDKLFFKNQEVKIEFFIEGTQPCPIPVQCILEKSDLDPKKFRAIEQNPGEYTDPIFLIERLKFLDKEVYQQKEALSCFWGINNAFDKLEPELYSFSFLTSKSPSFKSNLFRFFIEKYEEFRENNTSSYGDGYYADNYLLKVMRNSSYLQINLTLPEYESLLKYIDNSKLSKEDKKYIKNSCSK